MGKNCVIMIMYCYLYNEEQLRNSHDTRKINNLYPLESGTQSWVNQKIILLQFNVSMFNVNYCLNNWTNSSSLLL